MGKKDKTQADQVSVDRETPETEWPMCGGSYIRNPDTGALTKQETTAGDMPADVDTNKPSQEA